MIKKIKELSKDKRYVRKYVKDGDLIMESFPRDIPSEAVIEIGNKCNLNCLSCNTQSSKRPHEEINPDLFKKIVVQFKEMGFKKIKLHTTNEPIINKNIIELMQILNDLGIQADISTNGMFVKKFIDKYLEAGLDLKKLNFRYSIDGGTPKTFEKIRRGASFKRLVEGLDYLVKTYEDRGLKCPLNVNYNLSEDTVGEIGIFIKKFKKYFGKDRFLKNYSFKLLDSRNAGGLDLNTLWKERLIYPTYNSPCWIPSSAMYVLYDGRVSACCHDYHGELIVGDAKKQTLMAIWKGEGLKEIRLAHLSQNLKHFPKCAACYQPKYRMIRAVDSYIRVVLLRKYSKHFNKKGFKKDLNRFIREKQFV